MHVCAREKSSESELNAKTKDFCNIQKRIILFIYA